MKQGTKEFLKKELISSLKPTPKHIVVAAALFALSFYIINFAVTCTDGCSIGYDLGIGVPVLFAIVGYTSVAWGA